MIEVRSQPQIEQDPRRGWQLIFWMGEVFDYTIPFRAAIVEMAEVLGQAGLCSVQLPEYSIDEDFVEGNLKFGGEVLRIYYEHSLGFLSLSADSDRVLLEIMAHLQPRLRVA